MYNSIKQFYGSALSLTPEDFMPEKIAFEQILRFIDGADGFFCCGDLPALSIPFVVEQSGGSATLLVSHFAANRNEYREALRSGQEIRLIFQYGHYYIDPSWINCSPHAPTETKAVFEFRGTGTIFNWNEDQTLSMLDRVTVAQRRKFNSVDEWSLKNLPDSYVKKLLPHITVFGVRVENFHLGQLMALEHLSYSERTKIVSELRSRPKDVMAVEAASLIEFFVDRARGVSA